MGTCKNTVRTRKRLPGHSPHPPSGPRLTHLVVVLVDVLIELMQGHAGPEVSGVVLEKREATER